MAQSVAESLVRAFDVRSRELIALTGAGGKSGLMFAFGRTLPLSGRRALLTTTTRLWSWQQNLARVACHWPLPPSRLQAVLDAHGVCLITAPSADTKVAGLTASCVELLWDALDVETVVVEADGARGRWLKAPASHEPAVPASASMVIVVIGVQAVGRQVSDVAFRPKLVSEIVGCREHDRVSADLCARLVASNRGGLAGVPDDARVGLFINQVRSATDYAAAQAIAERVLSHTRLERVVAGNTRDPRVATVVWRGKPVCGRMALYSAEDDLCAKKKRT